MINVKFSRFQQRLYAEKILDLVHLVFGGMVVGQFFAIEPFDPRLAFSGLLILLGGYLMSFLLSRKGGV